MILSISFLFSAINLQTASKNELMCIKGIGVKKAEAIIQYRKSNKLSYPDDLLKIKGFGKGLVSKVKKGEQTAKCSGKKVKKPNTTTIKNNSKTVIKKEEKQTSTKTDKK